MTEIKYVIEESPVKDIVLDPILYAAFSHGLPLQYDVNKLLAYKKNPTIVVTCIPRCGSTYIVNTLTHLTKLPYFRLCSAFGTNEQDLYLPSLCINQAGCISQMHMKGTYNNNEQNQHYFFEGFPGVQPYRRLMG